MQISRKGGICGWYLGIPSFNGVFNVDVRGKLCNLGTNIRMIEGICDCNLGTDYVVVFGLLPRIHSFLFTNLISVKLLHSYVFSSSVLLTTAHHLNMAFCPIGWCLGYCCTWRFYRFSSMFSFSFSFACFSCNANDLYYVSYTKRSLGN